MTFPNRRFRPTDPAPHPGSRANIGPCDPSEWAHHFPIAANYDSMIASSDIWHKYWCEILSRTCEISCRDWLAAMAEAWKRRSVTFSVPLLRLRRKKQM